MPRLSDEKKAKLAERDAAIRDRYYIMGQTGAEIGQDFDLTPQRVSQILQPRPDFFVCLGCGDSFPLKPRGRPPKYHSQACRRRHQSSTRWSTSGGVL